MGMSQNRNSSSSESLCRLICMPVLKSIANQTRETKAGRSARLLNLGFPRGASEAPLFCFETHFYIPLEPSGKSGGGCKPFQTIAFSA